MTSKASAPSQATLPHSQPSSFARLLVFAGEVGTRRRSTASGHCIGAACGCTGEAAARAREFEGALRLCLSPVEVPPESSRQLMLACPIVLTLP
jgi:hypothetical protein